MSLTKILETFKDEKEIVVEGNKYVEKDSYGVSLKGVLQRGRLKHLKERRRWPKGVGFTPSTITYPFCRRLKVAHLAGLVDLYYELGTPREETQFDIGKYFHEMVQGWFWDIGLLRGSFECLKCDKIYDDLLAPTACPSGKVTHRRKHLRFKEVYCRDEAHKISARCDGILDIEGEQHIMDIKSLQGKTLKSNERQFCFEDLDSQGPREMHIVQLTFYMWMLQIERAHLLYISKNNGQIKSFAIPYDPTIIEPYLTEMQYLIEIAEALKAGEKPKLPECCGDSECVCHTILSNSAC